MTKPKILLGLPCTGSFPWQTMCAILGLRWPSQPMYRIAAQSLIYDAREEMAQYVLDNDFTHLMFLDADMVPPSDIMTKFLAYDKPIVSGLAFKRYPPHEPCIFKSITREYAGEFMLDYPKGLIEVAGTGMACTLIKREVFEQLPRPWFHPIGIMGEDLAFCLRATEAGFKVYCDTNTVVDHLNMVPITEAHYISARRTSCES